MNSILRKTLIAAAVAGAASANAATISSVDNSTTTAGIQQVISAEGYGLLKSITVGNQDGTSSTQLQVALTPAIDTYDGSSDLLVFTFTGATVNTSSTVLSSVTVTDSTGATEYASGFGITSDSITVDLNAAGAAVLNAGGTVYLSGVVLTDLESSVQVAYNGLRNTQPFDQASATTIATVASQFSASNATDLDATIDVEKERKVFVDTDSTSSFFNNNDTDEDGEDTFVVALSNTSNLLTATVSDVTHAVTTTGNFDWTLGSDSKFDSTTVDTAVTTGTVTESLSDDGTTLSIAVDGDFTTTAQTSTVTFDVPGDVTLVESEFTLSSVAKYYIGSTSTNSSATVASGVDIGDWGLSGATRFIEFFPIGTGITQFVYISNTSDVDAEVEMTVYDDSGTVYECGTLDTVATGDSVTKFGPEIYNTITGDCNVVGNRLAISLTINAPDASIDMTAGYNSRGDRVLID